MTPKQRPRFWETVPLEAMTEAEWEALCDGCAKCCLVKLEDEADGTVYFTDVHCFLLERESCRCGDYANRTVRVPSCIKLTPDRLDEVFWMPTSCAYRRLAEGRGLPDWHHLLTGDPGAIHRARASIRGRSVPETEVAEDALEDRLVDWPATER
ncbi:MAG: YcgN family cysteine cluster protein [Geminicoccaceae bacterium]|nr:MAG: YcgN family cysteine cluster protein [Geminicoccaceae bacterium]